MAQTYANNDNVLSKVKFGNTTYYLKDAAARTILDGFGNAATYSVADSVTDGGTGLVTSDLVYDYVGRQVGAIGTALNLRSESNHSAVPTTGDNSVAAGDFVVESDGSEWLYDGTGWREVGSENAYVVKTFTIAGVDMNDNITKSELQTALELGALAYKDNGSVKVTTIDSMNSFSTGKAGTYSVSSNAVSVPATYSALDVTPAGSITIDAQTAAAAAYDKTTGVTIATAAPEEGQSATYTPTGSVSVTNVTVTPSSGTAVNVNSAGTAYQLTNGSVTQGTDTTSTFATEGVVVSIGEDNSGSGGSDESETLIINSASTNSAVTASGTVSYTSPTLTGSLPTFDNVNVVTGITSASATASFSGAGIIINATPTYTSSSATMTQPTYTGNFSGTSKSVTPTVATTVSAAGTDGSITVTSETITPTYNSTEKTISVTFGNNS